MDERKTIEGRYENNNRLSRLNDIVDTALINSLRNHIKTYRLTNSNFYKSKTVRRIQQPEQAARLVCLDTGKKEIAYIKIVGEILSVEVPSPNGLTTIFQSNIMKYSYLTNHRDALNALSDMFKAIDNHYNTMERLSRVSFNEAMFVFMNYWSTTLINLCNRAKVRHQSDDNDQTSDDDIIDEIMYTFRSDSAAAAWVECICSMFNKTAKDIEDAFIIPYIKKH